jgi:hypothetical protein
MEARTIPLGMWVIAEESDGTALTVSREQKFNANMEALQTLLWKPKGEQVTLTKRWRDSISGAVVSATALAEVTSDLVPEMKGPYSGKFVVDFYLADPLFYGEAEDLTLVVGVPNTFLYPGNVVTSKITMDFNGILSNAQVDNLTHNIWVKLGSSVASGDTVHLDVPDMTAVRTSDDANLIGAVTRSGSRQWMEVRPGYNELKLTATSGAGNLDLIYTPAYL